MTQSLCGHRVIEWVLNCSLIYVLFQKFSCRLYFVIGAVPYRPCADEVYLDRPLTSATQGGRTDRWGKGYVGVCECISSVHATPLHAHHFHFPNYRFSIIIASEFSIFGFQLLVQMLGYSIFDFISHDDSPNTTTFIVCVHTHTCTCGCTQSFSFQTSLGGAVVSV